MNTLELAQHHLALVAEPSTGRNVLERSSAIAVAAAAVAQAEAMTGLLDALVEANVLAREQVELRSAPVATAADKIRESLKSKKDPQPEGAIG